MLQDLRSMHYGVQQDGRDFETLRTPSVSGAISSAESPHDQLYDTPGYSCILKCLQFVTSLKLL